MGSMKDLWAAQQEQHYPHKPGWKDPGISRENAERIEKSGALTKNMQAVLALFEQGFEGTADEAAERLGKSPFAIRPACTHLRKLNRIERTPERRIGAGGGTAAVLRIKEKAHV